MSNYPYRILNILTQIPAREWKLFNKHVISIYDKGTDVPLLSGVLYQNKNKLDGNDYLTKVKTKSFSKLSDKAFANLMSKLNLEFEDWMIAYDLKNSKYDKSLALIKSYNNRALYPEANRAAKKLESKIDANSKFDLEKTRVSYLMKDYQYYSDNPIKNRDNIGALQDLVDSFNIYYKEMGYLYNTEMYNAGRIRNHNFGESIAENIKRINSIKGTAQSEMLVRLEKLMESYDYEEFKILTAQLFEERIELKSMLHVVCVEYCIFAALNFYRSKKLEDLKILVKLYEHGFETEALMIEGKITSIRFNAVVSVLSNVYTYSDVNQFINKWIGRVNTKYPQTIQNMAIAQNCFAHNKYDEILEYLRGLKFEDRPEKIRSMRFELVALYELKYFDLLETSLANFWRLLKRNKKEISSRVFGLNKNLIKVLNYLKNDDYEPIRIMMNSGEQLILRDWISEKIS